MPFDFWHVNAEALYRVRADGTGRRFTEFLNSLLETAAFYSGLPISAVHLNLQINLHDGGADAAVDSAVPEDSTGWMQCPTVWQYKRSRLSDTELLAEIGKESVRDFISRGYSYRLCVCEEEAAPEVDRKEKILADAQSAIARDVPRPRLLASSHLASWVSQYPALVLTYFHTGNMGNFFDLRTWMTNITETTRQFVLADEWRATQEDLKKYIDYSQDPAEVPFFLKGETGVGKTRLAYETVASAPGAAGLVIYCSDEQAACARYLAMNHHTRSILVADECDVQTRADLKNALGGFKGRVRAVAINAEAPSRSGAREYFLRQLPPGDVAEVLKANFSEFQKSIDGGMQSCLRGSSALLLTCVGTIRPFKLPVI
jgi:hypothetical protein